MDAGTPERADGARRVIAQLRVAPGMMLVTSPPLDQGGARHSIGRQRVDVRIHEWREAVAFDEMLEERPVEWRRQARDQAFAVGRLELDSGRKAKDLSFGSRRRAP